MSVHEAAACLDATDKPLCLLAVVARGDPKIYAMFATLDPLPAGPGATTAIAPPVDPFQRAFSEVLAADRHGADARTALSALGGLARDDRLEAFAKICTAGMKLRPAGQGPRFSEWASKTPGRALVTAAADRLDEELAAAPSDHTQVTDGRFQVALAACRGWLGDLPGMQKALERAWSQDQVHDPRVSLTVLLAAGRLDDATKLAADLKPAEIPVKSPLFQWVYMQKERLGLLWLARISGRSEVGDAAAQQLLTAALSPDRPNNFVMGSGTPEALDWLVSRADQWRTLSWLERLDTWVRPGQPGWNHEDVLAVHRAWLALGRVDKAQALYEAVEAEALRPEHDHGDTLGPMAVGMKALADRWVDKKPLGSILGLDGQTVGTLDPDAAIEVAQIEADLMATSPESRRGQKFSLTNCAGFAEVSPEVMRPPPLPLDVSAACARRMAALGLLDEQADMVAETVGLDWSQGGPNRALVVAAHAWQADRPELAAEMLDLALKSWRTAGSSEQVGQDDYFLLADIAWAELHFRAGS